MERLEPLCYLQLPATAWTRWERVSGLAGFDIAHRLPPLCIYGSRFLPPLRCLDLTRLWRRRVGLFPLIRVGGLFVFEQDKLSLSLEKRS